MPVSVLPRAPAIVAAAQVRAAANLPPLNPARVRAIAAMLSDAITSVPGHPISDRSFWDKLAAQPIYAALIGRAEKLLSSPLPPFRDDLYLDYSKNGNRTRYQTAENQRRSRLAPLVLAECLENKGRFVPALTALIDSLCTEKTWVLPAHDPKLEDFEGRSVDIELVSSLLAVELGATDYLLGDRLPDAARKTLRENVKRRVLDPFLDMIDGKRPPNSWILGTNNWNAVCLAGVVGAALYEEPSRDQRARFIAAGERYSKNFLSGFTLDGLCEEGLGYWNYGFGNYYRLSEAVRQATGGKLDLLSLPDVKMPALFAARIGIMNGISPAFADCPVFAHPDEPLMHALDHRFGLGLGEYARLDVNATLGGVFEAMVYATGDDAPPLNSGKITTASAAGPLPRDYFSNAGILVCRPGAGSAAKIGVAFKGGHNAGSHYHDDVGSYVVVVGDRPVLLDPGLETYTARTFSSHRFDSKLLNSYGHPVPMVAGTLQRQGVDARGVVLKANFTPESDTYALDIKTAYAVPDLKTLTRTWTYSRRGEGSLAVTDSVSLAHPQAFGTAFLTLGKWQKQPDGSLLVTDGDSAVNVRIDTGGLAYTLHPDVIHEDAAVAPTRVGIDLDAPVTSATVTLTITSVIEKAEVSADGNLLKNGGFERGDTGWELPVGGMGEIATGHAATGTGSLRIHDDDPAKGSNVLSSRSVIPPGVANLVVNGTANFVSGGGIGLYVRFFNADGQSLVVKDAAGNESAAGLLKGGPAGLGKWTPFSFTVAVPTGAARFQLWIHSFNGALCDAYLDDLSVK